MPRAFTLGTSTLGMFQLPTGIDLGRINILTPGTYPDLCFPIVLGTVIFTSVVRLIVARRQL